MNNPISMLSLFLIISLAFVVEDLDKKVTVIQEQQEQLIQLIEANQ